MLEEAEKRDHRRIGRELDLFHIDEVAPGVVFWHPKGWALWQAIERYMRDVYRDTGYQEVKGPQLLDKSLWEKTGHWQNYRENMFVTESEKPISRSSRELHRHVLIFKSDLPLPRLASRSASSAVPSHEPRAECTAQRWRLHAGRWHIF